jgi:hypothetical protein
MIVPQSPLQGSTKEIAINCKQLLLAQALVVPRMLQHVGEQLLWHDDQSGREVIGLRESYRLEVVTGRSSNQRLRGFP